MEILISEPVRLKPKRLQNKFVNLTISGGIGPTSIQSQDKKKRKKVMVNFGSLST